ncbi:MAG: AI-2E family transporter [Candidatus Eiseniibacteriota bacterium]|jgi:predicted PurR-regulated permease PerM
MTDEREKRPAATGREQDDDRPPQRDWRLAAVMAAVLTAWLLFSARELLNPLWVALFLIFALLPYRQALWARRLGVVAGAVGLLWILERLGGALAPFAIALIVAYFLDPLVDRLETRGLNRSLAILLLAVPVVAVGVLLFFVVLPPLGRDLARFVGQLPALVNVAIAFVEPHLDRFSTLDIEGLVSANLPNLLDPLNALATKLTSGAIGVGKGVGVGLRVISFLVVTPLATFYVLRDIDHLKEGVRELIPTQGHTLEVLVEIDRMLGRYLRGQLLVGSLLALVTWIGLTLLGVPYALVLALLTGVFNIVPVVGFWLSFVPVLLVSLTMTEPLFALLKVAVFYLGIQLLEGNVVSPRIVGNEVGLNPVLMILAIVVFSSLIGLIGVVVAVPTTAVLALLYRRWRGAVRDAAARAVDPGTIETGGD